MEPMITKSITSDSSGTLTWEIKGDLLKEMKAGKPQERFIGAPLRIGETNWRIEIFPNGWKPNGEDQGSFAVFIKNVSIAPKFKNVIICREIKCNQLDLSEIFVKQYQDGDINGCADYTMTLQQIRETAKDSLSITITINIVRITMKFRDKIYYQRNIKCPINNRFEWNINKSLLQQFKSAFNGNQFCSPIYENMWALSVRPNGKSLRDKGWCRLTLKLCGLPPNIKQIKVNWKIEVTLQSATGGQKVNVSKTPAFDLLNKNQWNWGSKKLPFADLRRCSSLQIIMYIKVLSMFDYDGNDLMAEKPSKSEMDDTNTKRAEISGMSLHEKQMVNVPTNIAQIAQIQQTYHVEEKKKEEITETEQRQMAGLAQAVHLPSTMKMVQIKQQQMSRIRESEEDEDLDDGKQTEETDEQREIRKWFKDTVKLPQYAQIFLEEGFEDFEGIGDVTFVNLKEMGITKIGHQNKIIKYARILQQELLKKPEKEEEDTAPTWMCDICGTFNSFKLVQCSSCEVNRK